MSDYTTQIRYICESKAGYTGSTEIPDPEVVVSEARSSIFNFDYDLFDENHKEELETKILLHYYTREIGLETYALWHLKLKTKLREILPYYNQLYYTASLEYDPTHDVNYTKEHHGTENNYSTSDRNRIMKDDTSRNEFTTGNTRTKETTLSHEENENWNLYSDTPQGSIQNIKENNQAYLTNATKDTNETDSNGQRNGMLANDEVVDGNVNKNVSEKNNDIYNEDNANEWTEKMVGKVGTYSVAKLIKDYREAIMNIDLMIINDLEELFMMVW